MTLEGSEDGLELRVFWLDPASECGYRSIGLSWTDGMLVSDLKDALTLAGNLTCFPSHLIDDPSAYVRWGQRLRWTTPLRAGDEIAVLERISADAKARRHAKVERQRAKAAK